MNPILTAILCALCVLCGSLAQGADRKTLVSIVGDAFHINGAPTYAGREWRGHELIGRVRKTPRDGRRLLVSTSYGGGAIPRENVVRGSDFLLPHGNGVKQTARIREMVRQTRAVPGYRAMPVLFNEDDHFNFEQPENSFAAAVSARASWRYFDFRMKGEAFDDGYKSVPVNWDISSER